MLVCARVFCLLTHRSLISKLCGSKLWAAYRQYSVPNRSSVARTTQFFNTMYQTILQDSVSHSSSALCTTKFFGTTTQFFSTVYHEVLRYYHTVLQHCVPRNSSVLLHSSSALCTTKFFGNTTQFFNTVLHIVLIPAECPN